MIVSDYKCIEVACNCRVYNLNFFLRHCLITPIPSLGRYRNSHEEKRGARREGRLFKVVFLSRRKEKEHEHTHTPPQGGKTGFILLRVGGKICCLSRGCVPLSLRVSVLLGREIPNTEAADQIRGGPANARSLASSTG